MASIYSGVISFLNLRNVGILRIVDRITLKEEHFACNSFDPPSASAIGSNPYLQIVGYDITELLEKNVGNSAQTTFDQLEAMRRSSKPIERQYSTDFSWIFYKEI